MGFFRADDPAVDSHLHHPFGDVSQALSAPCFLVVFAAHDPLSGLIIQWTGIEDDSMPGTASHETPRARMHPEPNHRWIPRARRPVNPLCAAAHQ